MKTLYAKKYPNGAVKVFADKTLGSEIIYFNPLKIGNIPDRRNKYIEYGYKKYKLNWI